MLVRSMVIRWTCSWDRTRQPGTFAIVDWLTYDEDFPSNHCLIKTPLVQGATVSGHYQPGNPRSQEGTHSSILSAGQAVRIEFAGS